MYLAIVETHSLFDDMNCGKAAEPKYVHCDKWFTREPEDAKTFSSQQEAAQFVTDHHPSWTFVQARPL